MTNAFKAIVVAAAISAAALTQAQALNTRTWISGTGVDQAGCGPIANPCRTLQFAHDQTSAGGEIDVKDSAGYGSVIITKAITVINEGGIAGVLAAPGGMAITVNAGVNDAVVLRGLTIEGAKVGAVGIVFFNGGALTVENCLVNGFVGTGLEGHGIHIRHVSGDPRITISGTTVSYNQSIGVVFSPSGTGGGALHVSHTIASRNGVGFSVFGADSTNVLIDAAFWNSQAANNASHGFQFWGNPSHARRAVLAYTAAFKNVGAGIRVGNNANLKLSHVTSHFNSSLDIDGNSGYVDSDGTSYIAYDNLSATNYTLVGNR